MLQPPNVNGNYRVNGSWVATGETAPVPEPGAWTALILGSLGVGAALRARRSAGLSAA